MTSVVTLVRDRTAHLANLVRGLDATTADDVDLVVVRMGGEDPSRAWAGTRRPVTHVRARRPGLPLADARNQGAEAAHTDDLVFLDVDCVPGPGAVEAYAAALADDDDAVWMGGVGYLPPGALDGPWDVSDLAGWSRPHPARPLPPSGRRPCRRPERFWSLSFAVRRSTYLETIGGFDPAYDGYGGEDTDFALRTRAAGVDLRWLGDAVVHHQHHPTWDPPLPHLGDIVTNAHTFRRRWGRWPMEGWLAGFAALGLVAWDPSGDTLEVRRLPSDDELAAARRPGPVT